MECPACASTALREFYEQQSLPVNSLLLVRSKEEARTYPTARLSLSFCNDCGFIFNNAFKPEMTAYSAEYEETQGFSPKFREFAAELAQTWVDRYDLRDRRVLEIGCGKGEFLGLMVSKGSNAGIGFDPVYRPGRIAADVAAHIDFRRRNFGPEDRVQADAVVCRHTLEHVPSAFTFLKGIATAMAGQDYVALFEIPDVQRILDETAFWDVFYEHCSYFGVEALRSLFERTGFEILDIRRVFDDQYLVLDARPARRLRPAPAAQDLTRLRSSVDHFERELDVTRARWRDELAAVLGAGDRVVLWGAGSKSVAFLSSVEGARAIDYVVDINPNKHDTFMAGTGQAIVSPEFLRDYRPALVVVMNPVYVDEIQGDLTRLGVSTRVVAL